MTKHRVGLYEGVYIISPTLSDEARTKAVERITKGITDAGGEVIKVLDWGRRRMAYAVDDHRDGHYYVIYFKVATSAIEQLWSEYRLNEDLLRFLTVETEKVRENLEFTAAPEPARSKSYG